MTAANVCRVRGRPCDECPWRLDVPAGTFPVIAGALDEQAPVAQGHVPLGAPLIACHKSPVGRDVICAGWLGVEGHNHLGVRLLVIAGRILATALEPGPGWPALVSSVREMVERHPARGGRSGTGLRRRVGDEQPR
ncbi:MAG TPA: DUF6283 family protein [Solirubrobacteraceae bacterium]|nr:DUF6283 family protein [Solirubrobacteraceae bacterium]